ncbi:MAG: FHA domain-containing protein [Anaerolineae bacterium]|nr:FHA domain-containing protein [Anaerolineae bacterium]
MSALQEIIDVYAGLRAQGHNSKESLQFLRLKIDTLSSQEQTEFVRQVRAWELKRAAERKTGDSRPKIKPLQKPASNDPFQQTEGPETLPITPEQMKEIRRQQPPARRAPTGTHDLGDQQSGWDTFFSHESVLSLTNPETNISLDVHPQRHRHDVVLGRGDESFAPDVDLTVLDAAQHGVSRIHMTMHYDASQSTLSVMDMKSTNGSFINGVQLFPQEIRVLRHGDELRLGRLVLIVHFYFSETR